MGDLREGFLWLVFLGWLACLVGGLLAIFGGALGIGLGLWGLAWLLRWLGALL